MLEIEGAAEKEVEPSSQEPLHPSLVIMIPIRVIVMMVLTRIIIGTYFGY